MSELTIHMFPCLKDNYGYLLHDAESGATAVVDTPDALAGSYYLESLTEAYRKFFHSYEEAPLLVVNSSEIDFLGNGDELVDLIREIRGVRHGTQHYIPLGSR